MKKILFLFFVAAIVVSNLHAQPFAGGDGSTANPYQISTIEELNSVRNYLDSSFILINDIDMDVAPYNTGSGWEPLGNNTVKFTGSFNGAGHRIYNLYINRPSSEYTGLFGYAYEAFIDSLGITDCNISGYLSTGSLAGKSDYSNISNCYATGNISGNRNNTGGLVGNIYQTTISDCYVTGNISGTGRTGGLVGINYTSAISNCFFTGEVSGTSDYTGGLVGSNYIASTVSNCYASGKVSNTMSYTGGLAGYNYSSSVITNCYSTGIVSGSGSYAGGLVGYNYSSSTISNCYSTGIVPAAGSFAGGLVARNNSSFITNSYYNTETSGQSSGIGTDNLSQVVTGLTTAQMKQQSSFTGFDFTTTWIITNGITFPRLRSVYNYPVILNDFSSKVKIFTEYRDTANIVPMDNETVTLTLENAPAGMQLQDSVITWTPEVVGEFAFFVVATDANLYASKSPATIIVTLNGEGTINDPYQISTIDELNIVRYLPDSNYILMNDLDFSGSAYDSINSIEGWEPICISPGFTGSFNGAGHIIRNLYINRPSSDILGLFGYTNGAVIDSLGITDCNITGSDRTGGLAGIIESSVVTNCYVTGNVTGNGNYTGGLAGEFYSCNISHCYASAYISGTYYTGGLTGRNNTSSTISYCYATGEVSGTNNYIGGLVGINYSSSTITDCYSTANVSGIWYIGGLTGDNNSSYISNCYASGKVLGWNDMGGLTGLNSLTIINSYFNIETSGQSSGIGYDNHAQVVTGLTTAQMKQQSSFTGFDFSTDWTITNGKTFPRLQSVWNCPVILPLEESIIFTGEENNDTIKVIPMDNDIITFTLENAPAGMHIHDSIITWTPEFVGTYTFSVVATDAGSGTSRSLATVYVTLHGEGTEEDPYQIFTISDLYYAREYPDSNYILMNDLDFSGSIYDPANSTEGWEPICTLMSPFTGSFNGSGHSIRNLYINRPFTPFTGLFGYLSGAVIDSLGVINCNITGSDYSGGLAGLSEYSVISDCYATGIVSGTGNYKGILTGGSYSSAISRCYTTGEVSGYNYIGGLAGNNNSSVTSNCYSTGNVSGYDYKGGLVGGNQSSSGISYCYATGNVSGGSYTGGLTGYNSSSGITNSYYNIETSGQSAGMGYDDNSQVVTGFTTVQMKDSANFAGFNFVTIWAIRADSTYPALQGTNNAPFAFTDIITGAAQSEYLDILLINDYDFETLKNNLVIEVIAVDSGYVANNKIYFKENAGEGDTVYITYRLGEIQPLASDTLWGNIVTSVLRKNFPPALTAVSEPSTSEDEAVTLSINDLTASDVDGNALSIIVHDGNNFTVTDNTVIPAPDFNGVLTVPVSVTDGLDTSNIMNISITVTPVNDFPVLSAVSNTSTSEDMAITLSINDVTASDIDGDALTIIVYNGSNFTVTDSTVTPIANFNGALTVPVAVTDGLDTSGIMNISITVTPVNDAPVLSAVSDTTTYQDVATTLSINDVAASDVDGDALSIIVYGGDHYTVTDSTVTPASGFTGTLTVPVVVTDGIATSNSMYMSITVKEGSGINNSLADNIHIYPNPVKDKLFIEGMKGSATLEIWNINGQVVYAGSISAGEAIDVSNMQKGMYIMVLKDYGVREKINIY
ncbi:MAG: cadherin-like domain-containing protein [Bacteroidales bacterium]|nr:cadherin-like domain-containing protein [Bacteroidales bacterium]